MKYFMGEMLACPVCKSTNLLIYAARVVEEELGVDIEKVRCKKYCHYKRKPASEVPIDVCMECSKKRIQDGVVVCLDCGRWYPILDTIVWMLDDEYRDRVVDKEFVRRVLPILPEDIVEAMRVPQLNSIGGKSGEPGA